jgi:hypothetical protein
MANSTTLASVTAAVGLFGFIGAAVAQVTVGPPALASPAPAVSPAPAWFTGPRDSAPAQPLSPNTGARPPVAASVANPFKAPANLAAPVVSGPLPPVGRDAQVVAPVVPGPINPFAPPPGW